MGHWADPSFARPIVMDFCVGKKRCSSRQLDESIWSDVLHHILMKKCTVKKIREVAGGVAQEELRSTSDYAWRCVQGSMHPSCVMAALGVVRLHLMAYGSSET